MILVWEFAAPIRYGRPRTVAVAEPSVTNSEIINCGSKFHDNRNIKSQQRSPLCRLTAANGISISSSSAQVFAAALPLTGWGRRDTGLRSWKWAADGHLRTCREPAGPFIAGSGVLILRCGGSR